MRIRIIKVPKQYKDGGTLDKEEINPGLDAMIKARLALDSHFGNPTARRMTNYDTRSYTFPDGRRGNVYVGSYGEYVTPQIQDVDGELKFIENPWSEENWRRSKEQSMKFESPRDAEYFAKNYKRFAPMMSLYSRGGVIQNARKWHHAFGGDLMTHGADFDTGLILVGNGGTHEENPYEGVPMGVDNEGVPNLVEEGEVIFNDYVFSNRLKVPKEVRKKYKLRGTKPLTFADAAIQMSKESEERPNDPISQAGLEDSMMKLMIEQEKLRTKRGDNNSFAKGGKMGRIYAGEEDDPYSQILNLKKEFLSLNPADVEKSLLTKNPKSPLTKNPWDVPLDFTLTDPTIKKPGITLPSIIDPQNITSPQKTKDVSSQAKGNPYINPKKYEGPKLAPTGMRYLPAYASGIMSITDALGLTNKPDYGEAEAMLEASKTAGTYTPIKFNPVGNYLTYRPFDRDFYTNKLNAESNAARRALLNTSGSNRAQALAGILAADYNAQGKMGDLFRQAEEYNLAQRQKVEEFNRATNMANSEGILKADQANQSAQLQARSSYLKGALTAAELRQKERQAATAARSANLSNFINSLGDIGRENYQRNMIITDPSKYYSIGPNGEVIYKNSFNDLPQEYQDYITGYANRTNNKGKSKRSKGGYLTIRRK